MRIFIKLSDRLQDARPSKTTCSQHIQIALHTVSVSSTTTSDDLCYTILLPHFLCLWAFLWCYLGICGNRCPCSWLVSGREPGDTLQCRTGRVPSCRCSLCTRPSSRSPPPHKIPPQVLCTPPCPSPLADRCLTHLNKKNKEREVTVMTIFCFHVHILVCYQRQIHDEVKQQSKQNLGSAE